MLDLRFAMVEAHMLARLVGGLSVCLPACLLACLCLPLPACMSAHLIALMGGIELDRTHRTRLKWGGTVWSGLEWDEIE